MKPKSKANYNAMTKEAALAILVARVIAKYPTADAAKERACLAKRSRASLIHSVGAGLYGNIAHIDEAMCAYAYSRMTPAEQRTINEAG